jgi:DNA-binding transcriptional regulator YiaG
MKEFKDRLERIEVEEPVHVPTLDGTGIAETVQVKVPAWRDPKTGEVYLASEATAILDKVKARYMGLLSPEQIKALRRRLGLTQKQISELLQIGEKTWTRWETARERPFRSINVLLCALNDGKIDIAYLRSLVERRDDWAGRLVALPQATQNPWLETVREAWDQWERPPGQCCAVGYAGWYNALVGELWETPQAEFSFKLEAKPLHYASMYITHGGISLAQSCVAARVANPPDIPAPRAAAVESIAA